MQSANAKTISVCFSQAEQCIVPFPLGSFAEIRGDRVNDKFYDGEGDGVGVCAVWPNASLDAGPLYFFAITFPNMDKF